MGPEAPRGALADAYDCYLVDLDGVLYRGADPVVGAAEAVAALRERGKRLAFVTNNSSRTPAQVAEKLAAVGVPARPEEVVTSALATADLLSSRGVRSAFVVGEAGIREALAQVGIEIVESAPAPGTEARRVVDAVVVGFDGQADYGKLRAAALHVQRGARLVATNPDASYPAPDGLWPGAGALLAVITTTLARPADIVVGKPHPALYESARERAGGGRPLVIGDRIDTDIEGAVRLGWDSLLVLTGVSRAADLVRATALPTYVASDLGTLFASPVGVHAATAADLPAIAGLLEAAGLDARTPQHRLSETLVAEQGEAVVGTVALELFPAGDEDRPPAAAGPGGRPIAHLRSLAVEPAHRGSGLGSLLVARGIALAAERGVSEVHAVTETAESFFVGLGFERTGTRDALPAAIRDTPMVSDACAASAVALRRPIHAHAGTGPG